MTAHLSFVLNDIALSGILVLFIHYLLKNILGLDFMSKAIVNVHVQVFMWTEAFSSPVKTGRLLLGHI